MKVHDRFKKVFDLPWARQFFEILKVNEMF